MLGRKSQICEARLHRQRQRFYLEQVAAGIKVRLIFSTPGYPRGRGRVERFFATVNAATAGRRGGEHAFLGVRAAAIIAVGAVEDGDVHVGENSCVAV